MAWNEPGKDKDPWSGRGGGNDGPPDLDEAFKKLQDKLNGVFGGGSGGRNGSSNGVVGSIVLLVLVLLALIYFAFGFFQVDAKERAVIFQFGAFKSIESEGLGWSAPLITKVFVINTTRENQYSTHGLMLTQDESIVELPVSVQYNVSDVKAFVLNVFDPEASLKEATDSALRHVVGSTELDQVLSEGREKMAVEVKQRLQTYLDSYGAGIQIINVNIQRAQPPEEVRAAFDDVIKAKEDEVRLKNEAQSYANQIIPEARGKAQRLLEEAEAYKSEVVSRAEGETSRFENLLAEYKRAPEVTRKRLYMDAIESVMTKSSKVMVDTESNNMLYLPLDKLAKALPAPVVEEAAVPTEPAKPVIRKELR